MSHKSSDNLSWPAALLIIVLSPLIVVLLFLAVVILLLWLLTTIGLNLLVWTIWCIRGKDILFVYSDSPIWHDYIEQHIIPQIKERSIVLNWSERRHWLHRFALAPFVFRHFGGYREFNPLAIHFRPLHRHQTFRFWKAFKDWKHGRSECLAKVESDFFNCIGLEMRSSQHIPSPTDTV